MIKYFIFCFISFASLGAQEASDGWFPVEKRVGPSQGADEVDASLWVVFFKQLGEEKILVLLPEDPIYEASALGLFELSASKGEEQFKLLVDLKKSFAERVEEIRGTPGIVRIEENFDAQDLLYKKEGKWVREHCVKTEHHFYLLQTTSDQLESPNHELFVRSFLAEKIISKK